MLQTFCLFQFILLNFHSSTFLQHRKEIKTSDTSRNHTTNVNYMRQNKICSTKNIFLNYVLGY